MLDYRPVSLVKTELEESYDTRSSCALKEKERGVQQWFTNSREAYVTGAGMVRGVTVLLTEDLLGGHLEGVFFDSV